MAQNQSNSYNTMKKPSSLMNLSFHLLFLLVDVFLSQMSWDILCVIHKFLSKVCFSIQSKLGCTTHSCDLNEDTTCPTEEADDGSLCREDAEMVMGRLGFACGPESEELQDRLGSDKFIGLFDENEPSIEEVKMAFDVFDDNRDGFIDARELQRVMCILGLKEGSDLGVCKKMIRAFDRNADGRIDFNEFVKFMEKTFC